MKPIKYLLKYILIYIPAVLLSASYLQAETLPVSGTREEFTIKPNVTVTLIRPAVRIKGSILVLPGWKHSRLRLLQETDLEKEAMKRGYVLILPEMNTTLYESEYYPESVMKWNTVPGGKWLKENLIPELQRKNLFSKGNKNYVLGYSTGGRGAALLSLEMPELITAAASIAGDFNQSAMPRDRLMTGVYGPSGSFPERWNGRDNPYKRVSEWETPFFAAHAMDDRIVPYSQTSEFIQALKQQKKDFAIRFMDAVKGGHDYSFVKTAIGPALDFFDAAE